MKPLFTMLVLILPVRIFGQTVDFQGQASSWGTINNQSQSQIGIRYIPDCTLIKSISENWSLESEIACQGVQWWQFDQLDLHSKKRQLKAYRLWLRLSSSQFEARIGLQKLNFGSARMLRPLMWFDRLDPRDPLQLTEGVTGLLLRYYFLNNANIWLWGLYGNKDPKGFEIFPTSERNPEFGGRIQYPLYKGEIAVTAHHRIVQSIESSEDRLAFDGRWDIEIGLWVELALTRLDWRLIPENYQKLGTLGMDYTLGIGNGLYCQAEHFTLQASKKWKDPGPTRKLTALSVNYSFGMLDLVSAIIYYDWDETDWYRVFQWQRTYDFWQIHIMGFWNPDQFQLIQFRSDQSLWIGRGIQCMIVYNH